MTSEKQLANILLFISVKERAALMDTITENIHLINETLDNHSAKYLVGIEVAEGTPYHCRVYRIGLEFENKEPLTDSIHLRDAALYVDAIRKTINLVYDTK